MTIDFDESVSGKLTLVSYGSASAQFSSAENAVFSGKSGDARLGGFAFVGKENGATGNLDLTPVADGATPAVERSIYLKQSGGVDGDSEKKLAVVLNGATLANEASYSADFQVEGSTWGYVAGSTLSEAVELTTATYSFQTSTFFDANKTTRKEDDLFCWAATAANMLKYAGFDAGMTAQGIFDDFIRCFNNGAGNPRNAIGVLTGCFRGGIDEDATSLKDGVERGGYYASGNSGDVRPALAELDKIRVDGVEATLGDYQPANFNVWTGNVAESVDAVASAALALRNKAAVGICFGWRQADDYTTRVGGRVVTMRGDCYDSTQPNSSPTRYADLIISCSDDQETKYDNPTQPIRYKTAIDWGDDRACYVFKDYDSDGKPGRGNSLAWGLLRIFTS